VSLLSVKCSVLLGRGGGGGGERDGGAQSRE